MFHVSKPVFDALVPFEAQLSQRDRATIPVIMTGSITRSRRQLSFLYITTTVMEYYAYVHYVGPLRAYHPKNCGFQDPPRGR